MSPLEYCCLAALFVYTLIAFVLAVGAGSWMVNVHNTNRWKDIITKATTGESAAAEILFKSWNNLPFVDVYPTTEVFCPAEFPDDVIYDIWPGSRGMCDCL